MRRPIRYKPKDPMTTLKKPSTSRIIPKTFSKTTLKSRPAASVRKSYQRKTLKRPSPNPFNQLNMKSANMLYDPKNPSPKVKIDSSKLFHKMEELQDMLKELMKKRSAIKVSMNKTAKEYLNAASYDDPLLENNLKLKGIKGSTLR